VEYTLEQALSMANGTSHAAPTTRPTIGQARHMMQQHIQCRASRCPRKGRALTVLVEEGVVHPDYERSIQ